jgi:regulator of protease activity HflC (stomatin/prohibitin superfamily)
VAEDQGEAMSETIKGPVTVDVLNERTGDCIIIDASERVICEVTADDANAIRDAFNAREESERRITRLEQEKIEAIGAGNQRVLELAALSTRHAEAVRLLRLLADTEEIIWLRMADEVDAFLAEELRKGESNG